MGNKQSAKFTKKDVKQVCAEFGRMATFSVISMFFFFFFSFPLLTTLAVTEDKAKEMMKKYNFVFCRRLFFVDFDFDFDFDFSWSVSRSTQRSRIVSHVRALRLFFPIPCHQTSPTRFSMRLTETEMGIDYFSPLPSALWTHMSTCT